jgi:poly(A) polymerase
MSAATDTAGAGGSTIPRDRHPISRKQISANALRVLYRLRDAGFQSYLVGGAVRDMLLGIEPKDFDVATDARPEQVRQLFRNCRLIGRRFRLAHIHFGQEIIEVATFRGTGTGDGIAESDGDRELENGRLLRDNVYGTLEEDIFRRDFAVNALYYNIADFSIRDEVGGVDDIAARRLRVIGEPEARYREDPVRMLRAVRFAAKLGFEIDAASAKPIPQLAYLLADVPPARLFDEFGKLFLSGCAERSFELLRRHGLLAALMPQVADRLASAEGGVTERFIQAALTSSDARVAQGKSLTPGFLLAVLLWRDAQHVHSAFVAAGVDSVLAWQRVADAVFGTFSRRIAAPRRIGLIAQEIWQLQAVLAQRSRRRIFRLLAQPRFRAAWDFLVLRAEVDPSLVELVEWWRDAQALEGDALAAHVDAVAATSGADGPTGRKRRRRGGRRRSARTSTEGGVE